MTDRENLAARIEAAGGPDRELDAAIAVAGGWCLHPSSRQRNDSAQSDTGYTCLDCGADSWGNTGPTGQKRHALIPAYTASLDAAMMLVPEGWNVGQWTIIGKPDCCRMWDENDGREIITSAATPALALSAAAIRAGGA